MGAICTHWNANYYIESSLYSFIFYSGPAGEKGDEGLAGLRGMRGPTGDKGAVGNYFYCFT